MTHMDYLATVAAMDIRALQEKEKTYAGSWKRRGGIGAMMMAARKWDRLETIMSALRTYVGADKPPHMAQAWDIFAHIEGDPSGVDGSVLDQVRDLRRYLMLIEAEMMARGVIMLPEGVKSLMTILSDAKHFESYPPHTVQMSEVNDPTNFNSKLPNAPPGLPHTLVGVRARIQEIERNQQSATNLHQAAEFYDELKQLRSWERRLMAKPVPAEDSNKHGLQEEDTPSTPPL